MVVGAAVQPALDHHVETGEAEAEQATQHDPRPDVHQHRVGQRRACRNRCKRCECPDVPHPVDDPGPAQATDNEAEVVGGAEGADRDRRKALDLGPDRRQHAEQAATHKQDGNRTKQAGERAHHRAKRTFPKGQRQPVGCPRIAGENHGKLISRRQGSDRS
jgi:hypothetical protein